MKDLRDNETRLASAKRLAFKQRLAVVLTTVILVLCCVFVVQKKKQHLQREWERQEMEYQAEWDAARERDSIKRQRYKDSIDAINRLRQIEIDRLFDSVARTRNAPPDQTKFRWDDVVRLVKGLTTEDPHAIVASNQTTWLVIYQKGGNYYLRELYPDKNSTGKKLKLTVKTNEQGVYTDNYYYVEGNENHREWYSMPEDRYLFKHLKIYHYVNGYEIENFYDVETVDTRNLPKPRKNYYAQDPYDPDEYEDWEDYWYDEEDDLRFYYGY